MIQQAQRMVSLADNTIVESRTMRLMLVHRFGKVTLVATSAGVGDKIQTTNASGSSRQLHVSSSTASVPLIGSTYAEVVEPVEPVEPAEPVLHVQHVEPVKLVQAVLIFQHIEPFRPALYDFSTHTEPSSASPVHQVGMASRRLPHMLTAKIPLTAARIHHHYDAFRTSTCV